MAITASNSQQSMTAYQRLLEARTIQRELGCNTPSQTASVLRRIVTSQIGLRRFLGTILGPHSKESPAGWTIEFGNGQHQIDLKNSTQPTLSEAMAEILEEYLQRNEWPSRVKRGNTLIDL